MGILRTAPHRERMREMKKKVRHSIASYINEEGHGVCDLEELARTLSIVHRVPERLNLTKATEIAILAAHYLALAPKRKRKAKP